ncbi:MAG: stage III sporulation protein AF [Clostridia bacterium]|nr:stage III sporulation protein AF [Clostridia bacterium]
MNSVITAVGVFSASLFVAALLKILAPSGSCEKVIRLVVSIFVLICIVTCFKSVADEINISKIEAPVKNDSQFDESVLKLTGDYLAEYVNKLLLAENINAERVEVSVIRDENDVINITDISIYLNKSLAAYKSKAEEIITSSLSISPNVKVKE